MAKTLRKRLSESLRDYLGQPCPPELLAEVEPELKKRLRPGQQVPTVAELLVNKVVKLALDPEAANQWAVELVFERMEGKAAVGSPPDTGGEQVEEKLNDISLAHLNALAASYRNRSPGSPPSDLPDGPAKRLLDLPQNGAAGPQKPAGEPEMAAESP